MRARRYSTGGACRYIAWLWAGLAARRRHGSGRQFRGETGEGVLGTHGLRMSGTELGLQVAGGSLENGCRVAVPIAAPQGERLTQPFARLRRFPTIRGEFLAQRDGLPEGGLRLGELAPFHLRIAERDQSLREAGLGAR